MYLCGCGIRLLYMFVCVAVGYACHPCVFVWLWHMTDVTCVCVAVGYACHPCVFVWLWHMTDVTCVCVAVGYDCYNMCLFGYWICLS